MLFTHLFLSVFSSRQYTHRACIFFIWFSNKKKNKKKVLELQNPKNLIFPDLSSSHFHQNMGNKTTLQIHQISLQVSLCVPNKLNTLMLTKE